MIGELDRKHMMRVCLIKERESWMDPDMAVMDGRAVRWGQEIWNSWFGSSHTALLPFGVGEKGFSF